MPHFSPGSSELTLPTPPPPPAPAVADKLAELSVDEPLPETYVANRIRLLAQSPRKLYLYWEFERDPYEPLRRAFRSQANRYTLVVKLVDVETGSETLHLASPTRSQWLDALPGHAYRADIGFYARGSAFIRLLSSTVMHAPRASVSPRADQTPEFHIPSDDFARVLDDAGYVSDALEVSLEAADEATDNSATRAVAERFGGTDLPAMTAEDLAEMRGLLAALALGADAREAQVALSETLSRWFAAIRSARQEAIDSAHLLEVLRSLLGIEFESTAFNTLNEEAMRRAARVIVGASEVNLPLKPFHLWMPSMTAGIKARMRAEG
jgi:hypothetical protein